MPIDRNRHLPLKQACSTFPVEDIGMGGTAAPATAEADMAMVSIAIEKNGKVDFSRPRTCGRNHAEVG